MGEIVTIHKAKTELSKLLARVEAGEEIVIARGSKPIAKLVAADAAPKPKRQPGKWAGKMSIGPEFFEPLSDEELELWGMK
ncbi:type II toxin-antitoxin system Phd/YefM family antitoxin [Parvibaculum sp.]|jgi:prevent-host-death family protein|uniref:type II toxin-antitoxin system Phd/YefM family antitoxin n=1 Tax=Parvibaculum sp. TaxID=2024848 RepID=UPI002A275B87|nr:type II toxin-antitoxin system Phd/YefM family antitoxin [Parvibaculum sp.]